MTKNLNIMTKEQRTAMARIISDMIKADNIIEESEVQKTLFLLSQIYQKNIRHKYPTIN